MYPVFNSSSTSAATFGGGGGGGVGGGDESDIARAKQQIMAVATPQNGGSSMKPKPNNRQLILQRVKCEFPELEAAEALLEMGCNGAKIIITNSSFYDKNHHTNTTTTTIATVNLSPGACTNGLSSNGVSYVTTTTNGHNNNNPSSHSDESHCAKRRKLHPETNAISAPVPLNLDSSNTNTTTNPAKKWTTTTSLDNELAVDANSSADHWEDIENSLEDKAEPSQQTDCRVTFPPRSEEDKTRMRNNLIEFLTEEDIRYLRNIHDGHQKSVDSKYHMPFGSDAVNKSHLSVNNRETMIDEHEAVDFSHHPKWWTGCSRCDVIALDEDKTPIDDGLSYSDLKELVRSHIEQEAVMRGDQRVLPPGPVMKKHEFVEFVKTFTLRYLDRKFKRPRRIKKSAVKNTTSTTPKVEAAR